MIPGLIHKCYLAKKEGKDFVVMGSGTPLRQFIYSDDLASLIVKTLNEYTGFLELHTHFIRCLDVGPLIKPSV